MSLYFRRLLAVAVVLSVGGCSTNMRWPNWFHPGPAGYQRHNAIYHDPYPLDDVAPAVVGGRPREYQRPFPEVRRGRLFRPPQVSPPVQPGPSLPSTPLPPPPTSY